MNAKTLSMVAAKLPLSESVRRLNAEPDGPQTVLPASVDPKPIKIAPRAIPAPKRAKLNVNETRFLAILKNRLGPSVKIWEQAITLALDPPFKSYRADLAYWREGDGFNELVLFECKANHRFAKAGIAKAALAAKTYPQFRFELAFWNGKDKGYTETVLSP